MRVARRHDGKTAVTLLVINGDDGGLHAESDEALLRCARDGVLGSISVVATGPTAAKLIARARDAGIGVGLHFNLTEGRPAGGPYRTLTDSEGRFRSKIATWDCAESFDRGEIAAEARAQFDRLCEMGADLDHVNCHNHVHLFGPVLEGMIAALGDEALVIRVPDEPEAAGDRPPLPACVLAPAALRARVAETNWRTLERFVGFGFCQRPGLDSLAHLATPAGATEWMVHPGCRPASDFTRDGRRLDEVEFLCSDELRERIAAWGYRTGTFREVS